jgi:hypothetical protein
MFEIILADTIALKIIDHFLAIPPGIQVWNSINLSNPGAQWITGMGPGKPTWQVGNEPDYVIRDPWKVGVQGEEEVRRFRVGVRPSSNGLSIKVTDGGTRRIRAALAKYEGSRYEFDYETQEAIILAPIGEPFPLGEML